MDIESIFSLFEFDENNGKKKDFKKVEIISLEVNEDPSILAVPINNS